MWKYDICISCCPEDRAQAETLAESLRAYRLPSNVIIRDPQLDYRKIALESDGLPLDDTVRALYQDSRLLLMLCSPATGSSAAMAERLEYFAELRSRESIIPVIGSGDPIDAFPSFFIQQKVAKHIMPDMSVVEKVETVEPIAADLRADNPKRAKQLLRYETVRIAATALDLAPDALEQRHMRRRKNRLTMLAAIISGVFLAVSATFTWYGLQAKKAGDTAALQTAETVSVVNRLVNDLPAMFADNPAALQKIREVLNRNSDVFRRAEEAGIEIRPADAAGSAPAAEDASASGGEGGKS